ncbi:WSC domain protein [Aspergillus clavatus NRRL 1]|uniref:WSC domain protein n=1 Tax=Aspergillus clavatus (strain ATCC 1007 / CBS 513.65 / DSM 816 / NCTC 3887 / NRRL 1 / QM 1276 / 107) TaxID=344612 RepID=A1CSF4_ASPCL|nr:WSC domain protein [Aspergillus clavatus NRRL 1]EAW08575.1 WSC domain protein [Aspergillus clavatus NRRL 1]
MAAIALLFSTLLVASANATPTSFGSILIPRQSVSVNGLCGAYNGTATCAGSAFGDCCSQFGYCGSQPVYCGTGCQTGYGICGVDTTLRWRSLGCYSDDTNHRTLNTSILVSGNTVQACQATCAQAGFTYAGMEFGTQCFCGTGIQNNAGPVASGCDTPCAADASQICGGSNALSLYVIVPIWQSLGCYSDSTKARTLSTSYNVAGNTVEKCQAACQAGGYLYAGMEFGSQCFCGNSIDNGGAPTSGCATPCAGDSSEVCGGSNALSIYYLFQ